MSLSSLSQCALDGSSELRKQPSMDRDEMLGLKDLETMIIRAERKRSRYLSSIESQQDGPGLGRSSTMGAHAMCMSYSVRSSHGKRKAGPDADEQPRIDLQMRCSAMVQWGARSTETSEAAMKLLQEVTESELGIALAVLQTRTVPPGDLPDQPTPLSPPEQVLRLNSDEVRGASAGAGCVESSAGPSAWTPRYCLTVHRWDHQDGRIP
ncbi:hypothetical protein FA95DRAFT_1573276 [Auriscalpium vulgare]|uniref:Uncharacterized protein n=1 Tax=Auriscalpium vulgare TaxID=40419 RepID=A0ACB8RRX9_9AGAM|nr:hypothetical protein FA95DRAFT_1573276 [Auriscalpium vulgare]